MSDEKVLLVDDEQEFTSVLSERLEARGVHVQTAADSRSALEKVKDENYDVVVLDLAMPEMNGIETLKRLLEKNPDLQVIMLTGHATVQTGIEAIRMGAREVLEKPADIGALLQKISDAKTDKVVLVEKRMEERIRGILGTRGW
ncbi:MAG: response regulator [Polyangiaceae bacterium]|jgi:DNA-binding NtrC family response regulator|nr:response regulator [Polyangiaceae bacterium]